MKYLVFLLIIGCKAATKPASKLGKFKTFYIGQPVAEIRHLLGDSGVYDGNIKYIINNDSMLEIGNARLMLIGITSKNDTVNEIAFSTHPDNAPEILTGLTDKYGAPTQHKTDDDVWEDEHTRQRFWRNGDHYGFYLMPKPDPQKDL